MAVCVPLLEPPLLPQLTIVSEAIKLNNPVITFLIIGISLFSEVGVFQDMCPV